ncbi:histidine kinase [Dyadobacter sp. CY107]|uniref:sensor histidine kinase n=1 Tax=Dyadobacter fanqingshengii TaxID=2906443 RepID=UPI001F452519|nr:7TM-DISM domain-containing protein [Dyadobacter fanqingshengii]MCF2502724.1 histidine kinase [Dyadobacter fanqingshengii]
MNPNFLFLLPACNTPLGVFYKWCSFLRGRICDYQRPKNIQMRLWLLSIIVIFIKTGCICAQVRDVLVINPGFTDTLLKHQVGFIPDLDNRHSIQDIINIKNYKKYFQKTVVFGSKNPPTWLIFNVLSHAKEKTFILDVGYLNLDSATVYIKSRSGTILKLPAVSRRQLIHERTIPDNKILFKLLLEPEQHYTIYIKTPRTFDRHMIGLHVWEEHAFFASTAVERSIFFTLIGGLLLAIIGSIVLYLFIKESIFWRYGLYITSLVLVILVMSGYLDPYILSIPFLRFDHTGALMIFFSISVHVAFSNNYLTVKKFAPAWLQILGGMIIICGLVSIVPFFLSLHEIHGFLSTFCYQLLIVAEIYIFVNILLGLRQRHLPSIIYFVRFLPYIIGLPVLFSFPILDYIYQSVELLIVAAIFEVLFLGLGISFSYYQIRKTQIALAIQLTQTQAQVIETQESERQRIAADLHDDLGGTLATIRRRFNDIRNILNNRSASDELARLEPLIQKSNDDLRRISHNLMPPEFERIGLSDSLQQLVSAIPVTPTRFEFVVFGVKKKLPVSTELNIYRIVSELVQNIIKHASAKRATVQLLFYDNNLTIMVEDNGVGQGSNTGTDGIGIKNIKFRADFIGASLRRDVSSNGILVIMEVPYPHFPYESV